MARVRVGAMAKVRASRADTTVSARVVAMVRVSRAVVMVRASRAKASRTRVVAGSGPDTHS